MFPPPRYGFFAFALALMACAGRLAAQIPYTGGTFNQTFNSLIASGTTTWTDNGTVPGWYTYRTNPRLSATNLRADSGTSSNTGVVYSYGVGSGTTRALGIIPGSTPGSVMWGACFVNDTGQTLTSFNLTYDGEEWRAESTSPQSLQVAFEVGTPANLNTGVWDAIQPSYFVAPVLSNTGALTGTLAANSTTGINFSTARVYWPPGTDLWIRWENPWLNDGNAGLAINNVHFSASNTAVVNNDTLPQDEAIQSITDMQATLAASPTPDPQTRDLTMCAYAALSLNIPNAVSIAENFIQTAFDYQLPDGTFPTNLQDGYDDDPNMVQFTMLPIGPIFLRYGALLDGTFVSAAMPHIALALQGVASQSVDVTYTNIYTMQFTNLMLLGQITGSDAAEEEGFENLNSWISNVQSEGFHEYDNSDYGTVDYNNLLIAMNNTTNPAAQSRLQAMLNYFCAGMCANYVNAFSGNPAGAHSRDYSFPIGDDAIGHMTYYTGIREALPPLYDYAGGLPVIMNQIENGYSPASSITAIAAEPTRIVQEIWGTTTGQDRYTYICPSFSIGSASAFYGQQDKQIAATFASPQTENEVVVVYDNFDEPYGVMTVNGKPQHLQNAPATVQSGPTILSLSDMGPQFLTSATTYTSLATNFTFPGNADALYLNGSLITTGTATITTNTNAVLGVQVGNALVATKAFQIDGYDGYTPTAYIKFDGPNNAARFVLYHYQGPAISIPSATIRSGLFLSATTVTTSTAATAFLTQVANTAITPVISGSNWSASATFSGTTLAVSQNTGSDTINYRTVNGVNYVISRLLVTSGTTITDYAASLLDPIPTSSIPAPTFATAAAAAQNPVLSGSVALTSLGSSGGGESNLTYTWSVTGSAPAAVAFSSNGSNASKDTTATFTAPGTYNLQVVDADVAGLTGASSVAVTVNDRFAFWQAANFSTAQLANSSISGDTANPAGDGIPNLLKYALNLNPWRSAASGLPAVSATGTALTLTYSYAPTKTDLTYLVQTSTDLESWTSTGVNQGTPGATVTASIPKNGAPRCFLRLEVTGP